MLLDKPHDVTKLSRRGDFDASIDRAVMYGRPLFGKEIGWQGQGNRLFCS